MRVTVLAAAICLVVVGLSAADDAKAAIRKPMNVPAGGLGPALQTLAKDYGFQVLYRTEVVGELRTEGAAGTMTAPEALSRVLSGTGLSFKYLDENTVTIIPTATSAAPPISSPHEGAGVPLTARDENGRQQEGQKSFWDRFRLAQVDQGTSSGSTTVERQNQQTTKGKPIQLEEVIVTATKREERLIDVPMSIAVISNQDIERRGLIGMQDYLRSIPGVNQIDVGPRSNAIVIRGITTTPEGENSFTGATVATYFDETPITAAAGPGGGGIDVRPVDIERIEILRGPQGTTFGDASLGGTMRMIPVKPKLDSFDAKLAVDYSNTGGFGSDNSMIRGVLNVPVVTDKFALRLVGYRYDDSGIYRNIAGTDPATIALAAKFGLDNFVRGFVQNDVGRMVTTGGRLAALWQPTDKLNLSLNYLTQTLEEDGNPSADLSTYYQTRVPIAPQARVRGEAGEVQDAKIHLTNLVLHYDLGWAGLTSAASWIDSSTAQAGAVQDIYIPFDGPSSSGSLASFKSFTAETRVASHLEGRFHFLGGLFYEHVKDGGTLAYYYPGVLATNPFGVNPWYFAEGARKLDQRAVFGEVSYDLTDKLTATMGGRYFKYQKNERDLSVFGVPISAGVPNNLDSGESHSTFKANLSYKPTKDSLLYALWSQGFRLGHPTPELPSVCGDGNGNIRGTNIPIASTKQVNSDFLDNYEIGGKFTLFDRRMVVDAAVYHIDWADVPNFTAAPFPPAGCGFGYVANVAAATSDGAELQTSLYVVEGLRLDFGAGYTKAVLSKDAPGLFPPAFKGDRLPGSPKVSANLAAQYDFNIAGHKAFVRADSFYTGTFYGDLQQTPLLQGGGYTKLDARAGVTIKNLSVELFGRNLTNENAFTWRTTAVQSPFFGYRQRPRTIGVQLGYSFQ
jgi:iron complex outermembrane recepter protein